MIHECPLQQPASLLWHHGVNSLDIISWWNKISHLCFIFRKTILSAFIWETIWSGMSSGGTALFMLMNCIQFILRIRWMRILEGYHNQWYIYSNNALYLNVTYTCKILQERSAQQIPTQQQFLLFHIACLIGNRTSMYTRIRIGSTSNNIPIILVDWTTFTCI